jgi:hypothetical protein
MHAAICKCVRGVIEVIGRLKTNPNPVLSQIWLTQQAETCVIPNFGMFCCREHVLYDSLDHMLHDQQQERMLTK